MTMLGGKHMFGSVESEFSGRKITIESGRMAKQADGSVTVRYGDTVILAAVVSPDKIREGIDFFPLMVDYREKTSAAGKFPGGYIKREGRPTEKEILTARLTDRPLRPLFPKGYLNEVQIMISVLSADEENDPDMLAVVGASAALTISNIPFQGPVGAVRVGLIDGNYVINPKPDELAESKIELIVAGTENAVMMVEGSADQASEEEMLKAVMAGHESIKELVKMQKDLKKKCGKELRKFEVSKVDEKICGMVDDLAKKDVLAAIKIKEKHKRQDAIKQIRVDVIAKIVETDPENISEASVKSAFGEMEKKLARNMILSEGVRNDGRGPEDIRNISCEVGILPRTHGSALFTRGETQALAIATLGTVEDAQRSDGLMGETSKSFMLHYNFPPFSVGETGPIRGPGRREIGHGFLAERSLASVMPDSTEFPYTVRIVSDVLESNGSSSMATVCGGCLSLMDAGVPVKAPVAGIAMGLIKTPEKTVILSDILGSEDAAGDMDFKVAGTKDGITAFQMDIKIEGIDEAIMKTALDQARKGRLHILDKMAEVLTSARPELSEYAPRIVTVEVDRDKIGTIIGPGGKMIKKIVEESGAEVNIDDSGIVTIASSSEESSDKAIEMIKLLTAEVEIGKIYKGTVKNIMDFGAFVEVLPGKEGLVHIVII
ncbi:polyribonucleotide nucleotidyltransferase [Candidatus Auribacterota bacterium]